MGDAAARDASVMAFDVPASAKELGFVKERKSRFPGIVIIGGPVSLLHRREVVPLPVR